MRFLLNCENLKCSDHYIIIQMKGRVLRRTPWFNLSVLKQAIKEGSNSDTEQYVTDSSEEESSTESLEGEYSSSEEEYPSSEDEEYNESGDKSL